MKEVDCIIFAHRKSEVLPLFIHFCRQVDLTDLCQMDNTVSGRLARPSASVDNILLDLHNYSFS